MYVYVYTIQMPELRFFCADMRFFLDDFVYIEFSFRIYFRYSYILLLMSVYVHTSPAAPNFSTFGRLVTMARISTGILLAAVLLCLNPVNSQLSLFLRGTTDETPIEASIPETGVVASEAEDVPVSWTLM
jgi:hypothetical protein